jgi:hypothetical protein
MSINKAIASGKEKRRPYRGSKTIDVNCRNHGKCSYCHENRLVNVRRNEQSTRDEEKEL